MSGDDGLQFIKRLDLNSIFFFIDPPYYEKGQTLYLNGLDTNYHEALAEQLKHMEAAAWVITYDDCPEIRRLYRAWAAIRPFSLRYVAAEKAHGPGVTHHTQMDATAYGTGFERHRLVTVCRPDLGSIAVQ